MDIHSDFLSHISFCYLPFCSLSEKEISDLGAYALGEGLRVNQTLQELEWDQLLMFYTCTCASWEEYSEIVVYTSDHMHSWLMVTDRMRGLRLWPSTNPKNIYQPTLCYLVLYYFSLKTHICEDSLYHLPIYIFWYSVASATTGSQLMVCVH